MRVASIKQRLTHKPFEPFRIRSSSGETYNITMPFLVALMKSKIFIAYPNSDKWSELFYVHVAALEAVGNGHTKRAPRRKR